MVGDKERAICEGIPIEEYIGDWLTLEPHGTDFVALCPFHEEKSPSLTISPTKNVWYCHGCHQGGDLIEFVHLFHKFSYPQAVEALLNYAGVECDEESSLSACKVMRAFRVQKRAPREKEYEEMPDKVLSAYEPHASQLSIWKDEGISDAALEKYDVRYDPRANRIVYPIRSPTGQIINISGRTLLSDYKEKGIPKYIYYYKLGVLDTLFGYSHNLDEIKRRNEVIIFEGAKSVMLADGYGYGNCVAALTSAINRSQLELLIKLGVSVVVAFDKDVAPKEIDSLDILRRYVNLSVVCDSENLLDAKMAPVDKGKEVWEHLYERRLRWN